MKVFYTIMFVILQLLLQTGCSEISSIDEDSASDVDSAADTTTASAENTPTGSTTDTVLDSSSDATMSSDMVTDSDSHTDLDCVPNSIEICDGKDNNCNGVVDEGFDIQIDTSHCGGCNNNCSVKGELWPGFNHELPQNVQKFSCDMGMCKIQSCIPNKGDEPSTSKKDCDLYVAQMEGGGGSTYFLLSNGTVYGVGNNIYGQLGNDVDFISTLPVPVENISNVKQVSSKHCHACVTLNNGTVKCWGYNNQGQLGIDPSVAPHNAVPQLISGISGAVMVQTTVASSCALLENGIVKCWGGNKRGELGADTGIEAFLITPISVTSLPNVVQIVGGNSHYCALLHDKTVRCWGYNDVSQLATTSSSNKVITPVSINLPAKIEQIACGSHHTCALTEDNAVYCWGYNNYGQGGISPEISETLSTFSMMPNLNKVVQIVAGGYTTCALLQNGTAKCWGLNGHGQLGYQTDENLSSTPQLVTSLDNATQLAAGSGMLCAAFEEERIKCWGANHYGQMGIGVQSGTDEAHFIPQEVVPFY